MDSWIVVDLFSGAGGFSKGFEEAGFEISLAVDMDDEALDSFAENFPNAITMNKDIRFLRSEEIFSLLNGRPDVVIGSPPCEPFTAANSRRRRKPIDRLYMDEDGILVLHFIRIIGDLNPRIFVMENVPQLLNDDLRFMLEMEFARVGYKPITFNILRAEKYGNPSVRTRLFISNIPLKPEKVNVEITVASALKDLPNPYKYHTVPNHEPTPISERKIKRISKLRWGHSLYTFSGAGGKFYKNWIRLHPYRRAPTVLGNSRFIHPFENRLLTVREQARLMGFPDHHIFKGSRESQYNQIGEAVPVPLARAIAICVRKYLEC
ncbi:MAG: DNA cytosine methyltransferase [archaeon GB-1845-036]|nr:DNA cytosine methyltransferase [Candidatus Culexmicrobium thermophilum]HDO20913.1 DNA cytosine methyltransferase [Candidatus Bathyarchaeota archaeon]